MLSVDTQESSENMMSLYHIIALIDKTIYSAFIMNIFFQLPNSILHIITRCLSNDFRKVHHFSSSIVMPVL